METTEKTSSISRFAAAALCACLISALAGCSATSGTSSQQSDSASTAISASADAQDVASSASAATTTAANAEAPTKDDISINETIENDGDGEHAIEESGTTAQYSNTLVNKTGDSEGDEADFYGENAAIFASDGATLDLTDMVVETDGTHANAIFSYGEGTVVNVSDAVIETSGNCSGGLMTTGGGTTNASELRITTQGNSSAAIRSDRGGGIVTVDGGAYTTNGTGSPVIYSTADITVNNAEMTSTTSQGVVVEGKNSVTLNDVTLVADNNTKNSDKSDYYQAVMIYQSMSGDADEGTASFEMNGGSLTNKNGDVFFVNNTVCNIALSGAEIVNESDGVFLRAAAAGWGSEGSNGGQVTLNADAQTINGDMVVDEVSNLNLYLTNGSVFKGAINSDGEAGEVYVELADGSTWTLTSDSYITSLTCDADSIDLNGHTLYVDGKAYSENTASTGEAIKVSVSSSGNSGTSGTPPEMPGNSNGASDGDGHGGEKPSGGPPAKPSGEPPAKPSGEPPAKPGDSSSSSASSRQSS